MGKASSSKKVARAASTGGGRTARGRTPIMWYGSLALIVIIGTLIIYTSRNERGVRVNDPTAPRANRDHMHAAYGIMVCDLILPALAEERDPLGIHTHRLESGVGDGVIHVHPFSSASAGKKATLGVFADAVGLELSSDSLKVPGGKTYKNGEKCGDKPAFVRVEIDGKEYTGDPRKIHLGRDNMLLMIAFMPRDVDLPEPPSKANLSQLTDVPQQQQQPPGSIQEVPAQPDDSAPPESAPPPSEPSATSSPTSSPPTTGPAP